MEKMKIHSPKEDDPAAALSHDSLAIQTRPLRIYGDPACPVAFRKALAPEAPRARYPGFKPETMILKKGSIRRKGALPLSCDIYFERDVALKMRDGTVIYTDIFRPVGEGKYPSIVAWSSYGKEIGGLQLDDLPGRAGVPLGQLSELQKFEGPDPAFWVDKGYAVLNPDPRGINDSEGDYTYWGRQLAEDGYDFIEWIAEQKWSSGKVGMAGNSWLAISQWYIAAERPPHLTAIAPWEGLSDHYREMNNRGGIPAPQFPEMIHKTLAGRGLAEDMPRMTVEQQLMTPYWEDKVARLDQIVTPAYVVASFNNAAHTHGTFEGFRRMASREKWLRVNNTHEWRDFYTPKYRQELLDFFDHYLKGVDNGWEKTPSVRIAVLDPGGTDQVDRPENEWPLKRAAFRKLYLDDRASLRDEPLPHPVKLSYDVSQEGKAEFLYVFDKDTEINGYMNLRLWVEADGSDDMELVVSVEKLDKNGNPLLVPQGETSTPSPLKATGMLRVSHRALDPARSTPSEPYLSHTREEKLAPGQIVPVDIALWPMALYCHAGEKLKLIVAAYKPIPNLYIGFGAAKIPLPVSGGTFMPGEEVSMTELGGTPEESPDYVKAQEVVVPPSRNCGRHILHLGGSYESFLLVPVVPSV
jgi:hypothetical protein